MSMVCLFNDVLCLCWGRVTISLMKSSVIVSMVTVCNLCHHCRSSVKLCPKSVNLLSKLFRAHERPLFQ